MEALTGEVLDIHKEYGSYREYKEALDGELQRSAESFVRIGYLLKVAVDTDILKESGYRNVNEFAQEEYNLDKSQVSRFIRINDEFSENGYSDRLQERYRSFGYSKLALMLLLPAEINEELTAGYSKAEIQTIKEEIDEEKKVSDLEVMMEEKDQRQQSFGILGKVIHQIGRDDPEMYLKMHAAVWNTAYDGTSRPMIDKLMDALAPSGEAVITVRIAGEGRKMLMIKGADINLVVVNVRSGEKTSCTWNQLIDEIETLCQGAENGRKAWEKLYGENFPEKEKVAPVQPQKKTETRKASKVTKAKKPDKTRSEDLKKQKQEGVDIEDKESGESKAQGEDSADSETDREHEADFKSGHDENGTDGGCGETCSGGGESGELGEKDAEQTEREQLKGQMNITDYPQYMPDTKAEESEKIRTEVKTEAAAGVEDLGVEIKDADGMTQHIKNQKQIIAKDISLMSMYCDEGIWDGLIETANEIVARAESIKTMMEVWNG